MRPRVKVFFDGGCRPNPGVMEIAVVAAGRTTILPNAGRGTSADAEWLALIHALAIARSLGSPDFVLLGDAADVVAKASGAAKCDAAARPYLERFRAESDPANPPRVRRVERSRNLAGIALGKRHPR